MELRDRRDERTIGSLYMRDAQEILDDPLVVIFDKDGNILSVCPPARRGRVLLYDQFNRPLIWEGYNQE